MVAIDFGDFPGVNMQDPAGLGAAIFADFSTFNFTSGALSEPILVIPNHVDPAQMTAFVRAYSNNWAFNPDGTPAGGSIVYAVEVWVPGADPGTFAYRVVIDGFTTFYPALEHALLDGDLSSLYAGQQLQILGTQNNSDTLVGGNLADAIYGYGGDDVLVGNAGGDYLDGMTGRDTMSGGAGNDDYAVSVAQDAIVESAGQGIDRAISAVSYRLPAFVDDLALLDGGARNGTGNGLGNIIEGNAGNNRLDGVTGNDTLRGLGGDDTLIGGAGADVLSGGDGADSLLGGAGNDVLVWHAVDRRMDGGTGTDTLSLDAGVLNLTRIPNARITGIESIDLRGDGANRLTLGWRDVMDLSNTTDSLKVLGEAGDSVRLSASFVEMGDAGSFTRYRSGAVTVLVDSDITVV